MISPKLKISTVPSSFNLNAPLVGTLNPESYNATTSLTIALLLLLKSWSVKIFIISLNDA